MGILWSFFNPILMLAIYTFVFSVVFKARWNVASDSKTEFAIVLFAGLIIYTIFAECVNRAPSLILSNANYVKKVVFPLEVLPWVPMGSALFHAAISVMVLLVFLFIVTLSLNWTVLFLPILVIPLVLFTMGVCWMLSSLGVYIRDVSQSIGIITTVLLFVSPIFYPVTQLPLKFQPFIYLNPLTFIIEETRNIIIWGKLPNFIGIGIYFCVSALIAWVGFWWFQKTRKGFADVL